MPASVERRRPVDGVALPRVVLRLRLRGLSWRPGIRRARRRSRARRGDRHGRRMTSAAQRPQKPVARGRPSTIRFGITRRRLIAVPSMESSAGRSVIEAITETAGISMPPIPIERMKGSGRMTMLSRPMATVEPETITDRPACVIVSTIASRRPCRGELLAEAEDHQQRVVDRHAEPDERDQELDDDRDVGDVGQRPDERERGQDRARRDQQRHRDRGQRAEDEEQDRGARRCRRSASRRGARAVRCRPPSLA